MSAEIIFSFVYIFLFSPNQLLQLINTYFIELDQVVNDSTNKILEVFTYYISIKE